MKRFWILLALIGLAGCTTSYRHLSDPAVSGDGYDFICGGFEVGDPSLTVSLDVCKNVNARYATEQYVLVEIKKRWNK